MPVLPINSVNKLTLNRPSMGPNNNNSLFYHTNKINS